MRRANHLLPRIADIDNLRLAFWNASKGKRYAASVLAYQDRLDENLLLLRRQIQQAKVEVGDYRYFHVYEPKKREICAAAFSEQVLHHALMNVCHPYFERAQIFDSYASRKGKGTYAALDRARKFNRQHSWFLKLDVRKFFASIHHEVLRRQLSRLFKEPHLLNLFDQIIESYEASPGRGLPIGNLTSQYFANHFLSGLDHFVKENLQVKAYVRYMDDMLLWRDSKRQLLECRTSITDFVTEHLRCQLKPSQLNRTQLGLPFLGYKLYPHHVRLLQKSKRRYIKKLNATLDRVRSGEFLEGEGQRKLLPLIAFTRYADTLYFRKKVLDSGSVGQAP